ncbi:MAG: rRNA maturation RNase YbeY [Burkholderiales bacterium]
MPAKPQKAPAFSLSVQFAATEKKSGKKLPTRTQFRRWVKAALQQEAHITLRVVEAEEGRALNKQFRKKNYPTNVLTFVYDDIGPLSGDIVLCAPIVEIEAKKQKKNILAHYAHLTVHGVLHMQGYDHEKNRDAKVMEAMETGIMQKLGYDHPYCEGIQ